MRGLTKLDRPLQDRDMVTLTSIVSHICGLFVSGGTKMLAARAVCVGCRHPWAVFTVVAIEAFDPFVAASLAAVAAIADVNIVVAGSRRS